MTMVFDKYAQYYDLFYCKKNYREECDYLEKIFKRYSKEKPRSILDLACGTGGHSCLLAKRGYGLTGVDASKAMLDIARKKFHILGLRSKFYNANLQNFKVNQKFDTVISMF